jgi:hypothetical protein
MEINFRWRESFGKLEPACESDATNSDGVSLLCSLAVDHGGGDYRNALPWLEEGLKNIDAVKRGEVASLEWARDAWSVRLSKERATIYSLYDEKYVQVMSLDAFEKVLRAWTEFVQTPPDASATRTIVV